MAKELVIQHVAVEFSDQQSSDRFFTTILGIPKIKYILLSKELSTKIFRIYTNVSILVYVIGKTRLEIFIN